LLCFIHGVPTCDLDWAAINLAGHAATRLAGLNEADARDRAKADRQAFEELLPDMPADAVLQALRTANDTLRRHRDAWLRIRDRLLVADELDADELAELFGADQVSADSERI
jgi:hypothetical protein